MARIPYLLESLGTKHLWALVIQSGTFERRKRSLWAKRKAIQAWNTATAYLHPRDISDPASPKQHSTSAAGGCPECFWIISHHITQDIRRYLAQYEKIGDTSVMLALVFRLRAWALIDEPDSGPPSAEPTLPGSKPSSSILPPGFVRGFRALCASTLVLVAQHTPRMWEAFELLGLTDRYEGIIASVGYEEYLRETYRAVDAAHVAVNTEDTRGMLQNVGSRFDLHMDKTLCNLRSVHFSPPVSESHCTAEIFEIDSPDSNGALQDPKVVAAFRLRCNLKRLLHPGADTKLISSQYVPTINCLRIVDPPGVLLFKVADPIRRYLSSRAARHYLEHRREPRGGRRQRDSLVDENEPIQPLQQLETEDYNDPHWDPETIGPVAHFRTKKPSDAISTLVSIYNSKDLFVKELQVLLAQRLLAISDDNF
ncbi:hypothetical protein DFH06DRAFT_1340883 [Mycena polygramma]|nr:hypothetical protein DFH06DRAFT_1340883 [Mycena polygramma]